MAKVGEEVEYESDPEEENGLLVRRRREAASDDEVVDGEEKARVDRRVNIHSDESDDQGGAADYDQEEEEEEEGYGEEVDEGHVDGFTEENGGNKERRGGGGGGGVGDRGTEEKKVFEQVNTEELIEGKSDEEEGEEEEGKKENEPFSVPTAGAFYMHDNRFRDNAVGTHRRTYGGRRLWELKDDKKWGHDKFEEMTLQERHFGKGKRNSEVQYRDRGGKNEALDRDYGRRSKSKAFSNGNNQSQAPRCARGRGPRRYEHIAKTVGRTQPTNEQLVKSLEKTSPGTSGRVLAPVYIAESNQAPPSRKNLNLGSASPPFFPSGSSNKEINLTQKGDVQVGSSSRNLLSSVTGENFSMQQSRPPMPRKNTTHPIGLDKLYIDESISQSARKTPNNNQTPPSRSSLINTVLSSHCRAQGKDVSMSGKMSYQPMSLSNQVNRVSSATQLHGFQRPTQSRIQPSIEAHARQLGQHSDNGTTQISSLKTPSSRNSHESGEVENASESSKSMVSLVTKGKVGIQASRGGAFLFGGTHIMGAAENLGFECGDQNFPGTPAFLPVMQFSGRHPGGVGLPAVGMAFPGYVANPQVVLGNSEMTRLPVLAGAAGALGATCCSPYTAVDGAYNARLSGQTSSMGSSSKETRTKKGDNEWKSMHRPGLARDKFGHQQKPRRYSEMDFKQPNTNA
ncbi:hypothetical protein K2173_004315 [Erythroxylum novogranatense]|uniref:Btz domain-containing protein n=1 Tax=Erythroxylum novogranatense TaxID=1862640 RepID=A0AAV8U2P5_9ROSI|nr:hypothetical protein K2173_004315 [Erythroxylum novogranatense]